MEGATIITPPSTGLKGTATLMINMFIRKSFMNHEFLYQYHQNRLKNGEAMGI